MEIQQTLLMLSTGHVEQASGPQEMFYGATVTEQVLLCSENVETTDIGAHFSRKQCECSHGAVLMMLRTEGSLTFPGT